MKSFKFLATNTEKSLPLPLGTTFNHKILNKFKDLNIEIS